MKEYVTTAKTTTAAKTAATLTPSTVTKLTSSLEDCIAVRRRKNTYNVSNQSEEHIHWC